MTSRCVWSYSRRQSDGQRQTVQTMGPETEKALSPNLVPFVQECSLRWWPNVDGVVLVHCRQRQQSLWGTEGICWRGPCRLTTPLCTGSDKWLATRPVQFCQRRTDMIACRQTKQNLTVMQSILCIYSSFYFTFSFWLRYTGWVQNNPFNLCWYGGPEIAIVDNAEDEKRGWHCRSRQWQSNSHWTKVITKQLIVYKDKCKLVHFSA